MSLRHINGVREVDVVRRGLVEFVRTCLEEGDEFCLYVPGEPLKASNKIGECVASISNATCEGNTTEVYAAITKTAKVLEDLGQYVDKDVVLITNRPLSEKSEAIQRARQRMDSCNLLAVSLAKHEKDTELMFEQYAHLSTLEKLSSVLRQMITGEE
jgi:hypothetical protein